MANDSVARGLAIAALASSGGSGGTSDYTDLSNKPQINNVTLTGNKSLSDLGITNYTLPTASTSTLGGVKVDGTSITIEDGVISSAGGGSVSVDGTSIIEDSGSLKVAYGGGKILVQGSAWGSVDVNFTIANSNDWQQATDNKNQGVQWTTSIVSGNKYDFKLSFSDDSVVEIVNTEAYEETSDKKYMFKAESNSKLVSGQTDSTVNNVTRFMLMRINTTRPFEFFVGCGYASSEDTINSQLKNKTLTKIEISSSNSYTYTPFESYKVLPIVLNGSEGSSLDDYGKIKLIGLRDANGNEWFNRYDTNPFSNISGSYNHSEGYNNTFYTQGNLIPSNSHVEGSANFISGASYAHVEGRQNYACGDCQHVQGKYSDIDRGNHFVDIIGIGTGSSNRSDASAIDWSGNQYLAGNLYVGCSDYSEDSNGNLNTTNCGGTLLIGLPTPPSSDGTYTLQCVVSSGTATYSWI